MSRPGTPPSRYGSEGTLAADALTLVSRLASTGRRSGTALGTVSPMLNDTPLDLPLPYVSGRRSVDEASALIAAFGDDAGFEAAARADRSRDLGNAVAFAHWRQIERLIVLLASGDVVGTVH